MAVYMWSMLGGKSLHNDVTCNPIDLGGKRFGIELQIVMKMWLTTKGRVASEDLLGN